MARSSHPGDDVRRSARSTGATRLSEVAAVAGVTAMTVSRALNRPELVSDETRERVRRAVIETGYVPNRVAGALASSRSRMVAVMVPTVAHALFADVVQAITDTLAGEGYQVLLGLSGYRPEEEESIVETVIGRRPDAVVLTGTQHSQATRQRLRAAAMPVVEVWDMSDDPIDMLVGFSHQEVGRGVAGYLLSRGYRRLAQVMANDPRSRLRAEGTRACLAEASVEAPAEYWTDVPASIEGGRSAAAALLDGDETIEAVVCGSDTLAMGVMAEARDRGIAVPERLGIMGFGDMSVATASWPTLSSVHIDGTRIGTLTARQLLARFDGERVPADAVIHNVGFEILGRGTTR